LEEDISAQPINKTHAQNTDDNQWKKIRTERLTWDRAKKRMEENCAEE
jgi:hypothetical protein